MASPLPEAREYGGMILAELKQVMPSFVSRVERPDRGGEWITYLGSAARGRPSAGRPAGPRPARRRRGRPLGRAGPRRRLRRGPARLLPVRVGDRAGDRDPRPARRVRRERADGAAGRDGGRAGKPSPPPRPRLRGAALPLRDRLRLRRVPRPAATPDAHLQWQRLGPDLGAGVPEEVREAGAGEEFERALEISRTEYERLAAAGLHERPPTRSASPTASATRSISTRARRCT